MFPALFLWISSPALWTPFVRVRTVKFFAQITLCSDKLGLATTGPRAITQKALSS